MSALIYIVLESLDEPILPEHAGHLLGCGSAQLVVLYGSLVLSEGFVILGDLEMRVFQVDPVLASGEVKRLVELA